MSRIPLRAGLALLAVATALGGCQTTTDPIASRDSVAPAGADPGSDYKKMLDVQAMRGLRYDTGLVTIHQVEAREIVANPDPGSAGFAYQTGMHELLVNNDRHAAIAAFSRAVINDPDRPDLYEGLGRALRAKGKGDEALAAFNTALALDPDWSEAHFQRGMTLAMFGDTDAAIPAWQRAVELDPTHGQAHLRLSVEHYYRQDYDTAWAHLNQARTHGAEIPAPFPGLLATASGRSQ